MIGSGCAFGGLKQVTHTTYYPGSLASCTRLTRGIERVPCFADFSRKLQPGRKGAKTGRQGPKTDPNLYRSRLTTPPPSFFLLKKRS
jgi:hypothetical protein